MKKTKYRFSVITEGVCTLYLAYITKCANHEWEVRDFFKISDQNWWKTAYNWKITKIKNDKYSFRKYYQLVKFSVVVNPREAYLISNYLKDIFGIRKVTYKKLS